MAILTVVEVGDVVDDHVCVGLRDVILAVEVGLLGEEAGDGDGLRDHRPLVLEDRHLAERGVCLWELFTETLRLTCDSLCGFKV